MQEVCNTCKWGNFPDDIEESEGTCDLNEENITRNTSCSYHEFSTVFDESIKVTKDDT